MVWSPFSSQTSDLSLEANLELANKSIELARKEDDNVKALGLGKSAKSVIKDAEKIFASVKIKNPDPRNDIANAYHDHGRLLDDLGHRDKAKKSHSMAEKWGYPHLVSQHTESSQPVGKSGTIRRLLLPTAALSLTPNITVAMYQGISKSDVAQPKHQLHGQDVTSAKVNNGEHTPNKGVMQIPQKIFHQNITPPIARYALPKPNERFTSTPQLAYCISLLDPSMISKEVLDRSECDWIQARDVDPDERGRLQTMATELVRAFVREELKKPGVVAEVVSLAAVLGHDNFRELLKECVDGINQSTLLNIHLLNGLAQLIRNAAKGYIDFDDLVKILNLLNARLKDTHGQSNQHIFRLTLTISHVLDSMVDSQVEGLSCEQLHEPLSDCLERLQENSDPYLFYQAAYAYQALLYIPNDETILQSMMRRTGKVVLGISGVVSAVKALDLMGFIEGLQHIQESLSGAGKAIELVNDAYLNAMALVENGQGLIVSLKESLKESFKRKSSWYPALRGLDMMMQEGRFVDFERLVRDAPCRYDPAFRWGVCQRLGGIAANTIWDLNTRKCALEFLRELYKSDASKGQQVNIMQWVLYTLTQLAESPKDAIAEFAKELLQEARNESGSGKADIRTREVTQNTNKCETSEGPSYIRRLSASRLLP